jgi:hypothetical protein
VYAGSEFKQVLLLGMGGSSLCPEVMRTAFGRQDRYPELHVLDSTDSAQIQALEDKLDLADTLFIVSSKSGTTLEPNVLKQYFFEKVKHLVGPEEAGNKFVAITDPGSSLQHMAERDSLRQVFFGVPSARAAVHLRRRRSRSGARRLPGSGGTSSAIAARAPRSRRESRVEYSAGGRASVSVACL